MEWLPRLWLWLCCFEKNKLRKALVRLRPILLRNAAKERAVKMNWNLCCLVVLAIFVFEPRDGGGQLYGQDREPDRVMILTIDGKDHTLVENKKSKLPGSYADAEFTIRSAGYRVFPYAGLSFRYPVGMDFESEHDDENKTWSMYGDDASVDVLVLDGDPDAYIEQSVDLNVQVSDHPNQKVEIKKGKRKVNGLELNTYEYAISFYEDSWIYVWAIELPLQNGRSRVLSFGREFENGKLVKECREFEKMVLGSLKF